MDDAVGSVNRWLRSGPYCPKSVCWAAFSNDDDLPIFVYLYVILGEQSNTVVVAELANENNDPDLRPSKMWLTLAWPDSSGASGTVARLVVLMFWPLTTWTDGPSVVDSTLM